MNTRKLYQISTLNALMLGDYKGAVKVGDLLKVANIGIGTYDGLNGEAIFFNGKAYDGLATGEVKEMNKDDSLPFATVAKFDENVKEHIISFNSMNDFKKKMEQFIEGNKNYFYMIKIEGKFNVLTVLKDGKLDCVDLEDVVGNNKVIGAVQGGTAESNVRLVTMDHDLVKTARDIGICLGD